MPRWESDVEIPNQLPPNPLYTPEDLGQIANALGTKPTSVTQVIKAAQQFFGDKHFQDEPRSTKKKQIITTLQRYAKALSAEIHTFYDTLQDLDDASLEDLIQHLPQRDDYEPYEDLTNLASQLITADHITLQPLITALEATLESLPAEGPISHYC